MTKHIVSPSPMNCNSRIVLKHLSGSPARPWAGLRYVGGQHVGEIITDLYAEAADAADACIAASLPGEVIQMPPWLKDTLIAGWQIEGAELYRAHMPRTVCANVHQRQGYDDAWRADVQPVVFRRNPKMMEIGA